MLTGTPLNRLHKRDKWLDQAHALQNSQTLREIARVLRISPQHRTPLAASLSGGTQDRPAAGTDWLAEADETMFLLSFKGKRNGSKAFTSATRKLGIKHHAVNLSAGIRVDGAWHVQNVNAYHSRLKAWVQKVMTIGGTV